MTLGWNSIKRAILFDGFSGPGEYQDGEDGSPIIMLKEAISCLSRFRDNKPQLRFIFVEQDKDRFDNSKDKIIQLFDDDLKEEHGVYIPEEFNYIRIYLVNSHFEAFMKEFLEKTNEDFFAFIDPFGFKDTPYYISKKLRENNRSEVFINFMYEDFNRFLKLPSLQEHYNKLFWTAEWTNILENLSWLISFYLQI